MLSANSRYIFKSSSLLIASVILFFISLSSNIQAQSKEKKQATENLANTEHKTTVASRTKLKYEVMMLIEKSYKYHIIDSLTRDSLNHIVINSATLKMVKNADGVSIKVMDDKEIEALNEIKDFMSAFLNDRAIFDYYAEKAQPQKLPIPNAPDEDPISKGMNSYYKNHYSLSKMPPSDWAPGGANYEAAKRATASISRNLAYSSKFDYKTPGFINNMKASGNGFVSILGGLFSFLDSAIRGSQLDKMNGPKIGHEPYFDNSIFLEPAFDSRVYNQ